eukprot:TRINITY_DN4114_c0_g1_i2.p1 TRINITY_DN4114_c0_g1~~TRINITY_DN4114_c0_g1_i2.p1  ORF type:complete len:372 (-),score=130.44 TRINITY_DN4114_c0_g1_i2:36-1043(-)
MGNPLLDISTHVSLDFLNKYELQPSNAILAEEKHFPLYDDLKNHQVEYIAGGSTQNSIRVAQWMLHDTPKATIYTGCIGKDSNGDILNKVATDDGVNVQYLVDEKEPTGTCAVLVTDKDRSLVTKLGAANHFKPSHLEKSDVWNLVQNARLYFIAGFFLTVSVDSALKVAKHASENNKVFMMSIAAPFICDFFNTQLDQMLPYIDILFGNEHEAISFGKKWGLGETQEDLIEIAKKIADLPKVNKERQRMVIFTQGPLPVIVVHNGIVKQYPVIPIEKEHIVDLNGAGDAFVGGFLSQLALGKSTDVAVKAGLYCSHVIIQQSGCKTPGKPNFQI